MKYPHLLVHLDPEFDSYTYGHVERVGDRPLWQMDRGDILFFYATLDVLSESKKWGMYIIGHFKVDHVRDTQNMTPQQIKALKEFKNNAHLKRIDPDVDLLVKGLKGESRLYKSATQLSQLSDPNDRVRLIPKYQKLLTTTGGRQVGEEGIYRCVFSSTSRSFYRILEETV